MTTSCPPQASFPSTHAVAPCCRRRHERGFTLVELLMVMAVLAVLLTFAVPSVKAMVASSNLSTASNVLLSSMHLARSEAIKRNSRVVLCKSADGILCSSTGGWEQGWIIFHDVNNNGDREAGETIIQRIDKLPASVTLTGNVHVARYVSFLSSGATKLVSGGFQAGTLTVCSLSSATGEARQIVLNAVGRPRVQKVGRTACA